VVGLVPALLSRSGETALPRWNGRRFYPAVQFRCHAVGPHRNEKIRLSKNLFIKKRLLKLLDDYERRLSHGHVLAAALRPRWDWQDVRCLLAGLAVQFIFDRLTGGLRACGLFDWPQQPQQMSGMRVSTPRPLSRALEAKAIGRGLCRRLERIFRPVRIVARWASRPSSERCCRCVETLSYAITRSMTKGQPTVWRAVVTDCRTSETSLTS